MDNLLLAGACLAAVERAVAETNLSAVPPLGRQHSLLNTIEMLIHKMGHLIPHLPAQSSADPAVHHGLSLIYTGSQRTGQLNAENVLIYPLSIYADQDIGLNCVD